LENTSGTFLALFRNTLVASFKPNFPEKESEAYEITMLPVRLSVSLSVSVPFPNNFLTN
jgi:hypothetical protein